MLIGTASIKFIDKMLKAFCFAFSLEDKLEICGIAETPKPYKMETGKLITVCAAPEYKP